MKFNKTKLDGSFVIDLDKREDERGFFARLFCINEFDQNQADRNIVQVNNSLSRDKGTLRGIHYQLSPKSETKIVRCIKGSLWDVIVDLMPDSPTFLQWFGETLSAENRRMMFVPKGFGHGFITLEPDTEAIYFVTEFYSPEHERGLRWDDPKIGIEWPIEPVIISEKDRQHKEFDINYNL
jgi:dTDP-4-dehydrorhamnose 3,5-epimerase